MSMDHFHEEIIVKKNRTMQDVVYVISWIMIVVFGILGMVLLTPVINAIASGNFDIFSIVLTVVMIGGAVLLYLYKDKLRTEYEYTFTNGDMDFAIVMNNSKRKALGTMRVKNVEAFGPVRSGAFIRYSTMKDVKISNWFLNRGSELYFFYFAKEGNKRMIVIEPSEEMVEMIKTYLPRGVYQEH